MQFEIIHQEIQELIDASVFKGVLVPGAGVYYIENNNLEVAFCPVFGIKNNLSARNKLIAYYERFKELAGVVSNKYKGIVWKNEYQVEFLKVFGEEAIIFW